MRLLHNYWIYQHVGTKPNVQEHPNVRYYVDVFTNVNDNPKPNLLEDAHGLPIDLIEPTCGLQQVGNSSTTMQDAPSFVNLQNAPILVNLLSFACLFVRRTRGKKPLAKYMQSHVTSIEYLTILRQKTLYKEVVENVI